jgi:hypothetical protein
MLIFVWLSTLALVAGLAADTTRIEDHRLIVEPLGSSFQIPQRWFEPQATRYFPDQGCDSHSALAARFHVGREAVSRLAHATGPWDTEFSNLVDSVLPLTSAVAQVGAEGWGAESKCFGDLQLRVYVSDIPIDSVRSRAETRGLRTANRFFPSKIAQETDTLGWSIQKLAWDAFYFDYGAPAYVEFLSRRINGRTLTLVFMYSTDRGNPITDRELILKSFREQS